MTAPDVAIYVSAATAWEVAIKVTLGKLPEARSFLDVFESELRIMGYASLAVSVPHALHAGMLPRHHADPFDRMIIAQSLVEDLPILSNDTVFDRYGVARIW